MLYVFQDVEGSVGTGVSVGGSDVGEAEESVGAREIVGSVVCGSCVIGATRVFCDGETTR